LSVILDSVLYTVYYLIVAFLSVVSRIHLWDA